MFSPHPHEKMVTMGGDGCVDCVFHSANIHQNITWFTLNIHTLCLSKERARGLDLTVNKRPCLLGLSEGEGKSRLGTVGGTAGDHSESEATKGTLDYIPNIRGCP